MEPRSQDPLIETPGVTSVDRSEGGVLERSMVVA